MPRIAPALAVAWLAAVVAFLVMAAFASAHNTFPNDVWLTHHFQDIRSGALSNALDATENFGQFPLIVPITLVAAAAVFLLGGRLAALLVLLTVGARLVSTVVKEVVDRPRPSDVLVRVNDHMTDPSFPSGHALNSMLLYGFLFYLAIVYVPNVWLRLAVQAVCLWLIIGNGLQRVYSGEHWTSDVLGGYFLGAIGVALLIGIHRLVILPREGVPYRRPARLQA